MKQELSLISSNNHKRCLTKSQTYLAYFFLFSFAGWIMETIYSFIVLGHFTNRGFFYGPICPIYGCGGIMILTFIGKLKKKPIQLSITSIIVFSVFEYLIGYGVEALYGISLWDYTNDFMNLNGRISLFYSISWGVIALLFVYILLPILQKLAKKMAQTIPYIIQSFFVKLSSIVFFIDVIYSFIEHSSLNI